MAARYAALEGGLSAGAYTAAIAAFITRLQLRLDYDVAVLYRVPLDPSDPDDMWKLIQVAFTIKSGQVAKKAWSRRSRS